MNQIYCILTQLVNNNTLHPEIYSNEVSFFKFILKILEKAEGNCTSVHIASMKFNK